MPHRLEPRESLVVFALPGALLAILLTSVFLGTPKFVIDAANIFDRSVFVVLGRFARRSWVIDTLIYSLWTQAALQAGVVMVLVWGEWFAQPQTPAGREKRAAILSSIVGVYAALLLTLTLRALLPFRLRPVIDATSMLHMPYLPIGEVVAGPTTAFPSGHATYLFGLAIGLWSVSRRLALIVGLYGLFFVCMPRVYFGRHWATDILAGAAIAVSIVPAVNVALRWKSLGLRMLGLSDRFPLAFYYMFFFFGLDIAMDFAFSKFALKGASILDLLGDIDLGRIVLRMMDIPSS